MNYEYKEPLVVQEVAPRDGLQIEKQWVETEDKIALIDAFLVASVFLLTLVGGTDAVQHTLAHLLPDRGGDGRRAVFHAGDR